MNIFNSIRKMYVFYAEQSKIIINILARINNS